MDRTLLRFILHDDMPGAVVYLRATRNYTKQQLRAFRLLCRFYRPLGLPEYLRVATVCDIVEFKRGVLREVITATGSGECAEFFLNGDILRTYSDSRDSARTCRYGLPACCVEGVPYVWYRAHPGARPLPAMHLRRLGWAAPHTS